MSQKGYEKKKFVLTNSMTGKREEFKPANPDKVQYYSCGPTVYGALHIGNARALLVGDFLHRWLKHIGYGVNFVRNYTDVDDKIIDKANAEGKSSFDVAKYWEEYCEEDIRLLGMGKPTQTVRVTESIPDIIDLIGRIIARKHAYIVDGEVLFSVDSFKTYGKLSGKNPDDLKAGARVEVDTKKKNPADFSLWKPAKPGEPSWDSPWGKGRPGWHIECSAMIAKWMGESIDIHHGGQDLIFPHHENEIAQSEAATGKNFCSHWVHHAFLTAGNEKMSKSLGNILTTREFIERYTAELLKMIYVSFHFRSTVPYTEEMLTQVLGDLERIYLVKKWAKYASQEPVSPQGKGKPWEELLGRANQCFDKMEEELYADLNTPGALGHLFTLVRDINRVEAIASGRPGLPAQSSAERQQVAKEYLSLLEDRLHPLLNVFKIDPEKMLSDIEQIRRRRSQAAVGSTGLPSDEEIKALIAERNEARKSKNFKRADEIRISLDSRGITLVDAPQGTTWKTK